MSVDMEQNATNDAGLAAWLGDSDDEQKPGKVLEMIDLQYQTGPSDSQISAALENLDRRLDDAAEGIVYYSYLEDQRVGKLFVGMTDHGLVSLQFVDTEDEFRARIEQRRIVYAPGKLEEATQQVGEYLRGERKAFQLPVDLSGMTPFQQTVLNEVSEVPRGEVVTYGDLARRIGKPRAARAVGQALGSNPVPIVVPCHRVIASDGSLGGYSGRRGIKTKEALLTLEGAWS
ncbi:MAG: methylated-DNA--[protein]-cysteine S-methyltransferase [Anaerolineales bacterium]